MHAVLGAGVDTDCGGGGTPNWGNDTLLELMTNASTREMIEPLIDASLRRLFTVRMRLGHFDAPSLQPWGQYGLEHVDTPAHRELAMEAALQVLRMDHRVRNARLHVATQVSMSVCLDQCRDLCCSKTMQVHCPCSRKRRWQCSARAQPPRIGSLAITTNEPLRQVYCCLRAMA